MFQMKYLSEIHFLSCFILHFVNPIERETEPEPEMEKGLFTFGRKVWFNSRARNERKAYNQPLFPFPVNKR